MAKIIIDAREYGATGTGTYLKYLLDNLQRIDSHNSYTVLLKPKDIDGFKPFNKHFKKLACPYKEFTFSEQIGLWKQLHDLKPDLVHFSMVQQPILYQGKVATTMHDLTTVRFRNPSKNWLIFTLKQQVYKFVNYWAAHKSSAIFTPSEFVKDDVARYTRINSRKITVTYEGADELSAKAEPYQELEGKEFIMYVGRPLPHKNLERLIDAFADLRQQNPSLRLVLAGKQDTLFRRLERQSQIKGVKNIIFTGYVSDGQLRWLYEHTAAYVFPSLSEGFGLPGLEAMMHGAPVVSSNATCLPEVYKDAVIYFNPLDVAEMSASIQKVLNDNELRKRLIKRGHALVNTYSWARMSEQTFAVYQKILESAPDNPSG